MALVTGNAPKGHDSGSGIQVLDRCPSDDPIPVPEAILAPTLGNYGYNPYKLKWSRYPPISHFYFFYQKFTLFQVRVSIILTNAPFMLSLDCDHYINNSKAVREAMCFLIDPQLGKKLCMFDSHNILMASTDMIDMRTEISFSSMYVSLALS
ncbi:hypothetical protein AMTR_s00067p00196540 [Amborella trichopoda]|uniref:Glycosyltransferase 2-like domain-containing protein n=1 Tax=Amborella trichopoda TaxID=13333 RepID=U5D007_AMBTC|nr:hypothetical protein AMTR_s00067p00196540 [Amborella trichopoda]